jgi:hypothetical protein
MCSCQFYPEREGKIDFLAVLFRGFHCFSFKFKISNSKILQIVPDGKE